MERELLLLGLLRDQDMHGYQINEHLRMLLGDNTRLKKATVYRLLAKMEENRWVSTYEEQESNRPLRRVYAITADGETQFEQMLRRSLPDYRGLDLAGSVDELFWDVLPEREAVRLLRQRRSKLDSRLLAAYRRSPLGRREQLALRHYRRLLRAELEWLDEFIAEVAAGGTIPPEASAEPPQETISLRDSPTSPEISIEKPEPDRPKRPAVRKSTWQPVFD